MADPTPTDDPLLSPPSHPSDVGTLGKYRVLKLLGKGGMGAVFLGYDPDLDRQVALKVMLPSYAARPEARERFLREARAAAKVKSDFVAPIYEVGEDLGAPYLAMEYLRGRSLDEYLREKGQPTIAQAVRIAREAAAGLAAAHETGLVHRDVKPANLWLEFPKGRVKLLDFGLARRQQTGDPMLTADGQAVGTPAFMSPEQARGEAVDRRTDLYSLGAVLYLMLTGRLPYPGTTAMEVIIRLTTADPAPIHELNPAVPEPLAALVHRMLAKNPAARPASAREVIAALKSADAPLSVAAQPIARRDARTEPMDAPPRRSRRALALELGVAGLLAAAVGVSVWRATRPESPSAPADQPATATTPGSTSHTAPTGSPPPTTTDPKVSGTKKDPPAGGETWRELFVGTEPTGWDAKLRGGYTILKEGDRSVLQFKPGASLFTNTGDYRDFHLSLEVRAPATDKPIGNVSYHVVESMSQDNRAFQLALVPKVFGRLNLWAPEQTSLVPGEVRGGRIVARPGAMPTHEPPGVGGRHKRVGEWNLVEVVCLGNTCLHAIDGKVVFAATDLTFRGKPVTAGRLKINAYVEMAVRDVRIRTPIASVPSKFEPKTGK